MECALCEIWIMECEVGWNMNYAINECVKAWEEEEWLCVEPPAGLLHQAWS